MKRKRTRAAILAALILGLCASDGRADTSLFERIGKDASLAKLFPDSEARAEVQDGFLIGTGVERIRRLPDGNLRIERTRRYTKVRDLESDRIATLPEPWDARSTLIVTPALRLRSVDTRLWFKRSGDGVFKDHKLSERHDWLFAVDRTLIRVSKSGQQLIQETFLGQKKLDGESYDYPADATPLEIVGMFLSVAVDRRLDQFEFELLLPGGSTHGISAHTVRTRDLRRFAKGYSVPQSRLISRELTAVVDLRLTSPVKYLFFPHHFYMAFSAQDPWKLTALWGGDPDENLQAFRVD